MKPLETARAHQMATLWSESELLAVVSQFLATEAMLLDEGRFEEWYELLDDELTYEVPLRSATEARADELAPGAFRVRDNKQMIRTRIDRLGTGNSYSESPPSRTVRAVSSVCIVSTPSDDVVCVSSALLVYRHRGIDPGGDLIPARRNDRLRLTSAGPRLFSRSIVLAETVLGTPNLGIFL